MGRCILTNKIDFGSQNSNWYSRPKPTKIIENNGCGRWRAWKKPASCSRRGAKLRHFRVLKGISQEQLALDCDLNVNTIGMIERGQKNATIFTLKRICDGLGITLATLFLYDGGADTAEEETIQRIEAVLRQMPRRDVERVARIVEELASFGK